MKTIVIMLMLCFMVNAHAQKVIKLGEAKISYSPEMKITSNLNGLRLNVKENYAGQFSQNALKFMEENFNIHEVIGSFEPGTYDQFDVTFRSRKGYLFATFDKNGELINTYQKFNNIVLPDELRREIYKNYNGYSIVKNKYIASGKGNVISKQHYLITMRNGAKKQKVKIVPTVVAGGKVAAVN